MKIPLFSNFVSRFSLLFFAGENREKYTVLQ